MACCRTVGVGHIKGTKACKQWLQRLAGGITAALQQPWLWALAATPTAKCQQFYRVVLLCRDGWPFVMTRTTRFGVEVSVLYVALAGPWPTFIRLLFCTCTGIIGRSRRRTCGSSHQVTEIQGESMPRFNRTQKHARGFRKSLLRAWMDGFSFLESFQSIGVRENG